MSSKKAAKKPEKKKRQVVATPAPWVEQDPDVWPGPRFHNPDVDMVQLALQKLWQVTLRKLDGEEPPKTYLVVASSSNLIHKTIPNGWEVADLKDAGYTNVFIARSQC